MPYKDKAKHNEWQTAHAEKCRAAVRLLKAGPCTDCGNRFPHYMMEFDHVRGVKYRNVSALSKRSLTSGRLREELEKCELVCANCHAARTYFRSKRP